jgi:hypothetical protein
MPHLFLCTAIHKGGILGRRVPLLLDRFCVSDEAFSWHSSDAFHCAGRDNRLHLRLCRVSEVNELNYTQKRAYGSPLNSHASLHPCSLRLRLAPIPITKTNKMLKRVHFRDRMRSSRSNQNRIPRPGPLGRGQPNAQSLPTSSPALPPPPRFSVRGSDSTWA